MMLWDIIRDWFVQNIFGGMDSQGIVHSIFIGQGFNVADADTEFMYGDSFYPYGAGYNEYSGYSFPWWDGDNFGPVTGLSLSDWLSTTATIIVLAVGCFLAFAFIAWLFKKVGGAITRIGQ